MLCMVDDKLRVLEQSMDKISSLALKINSTFAVKCREIQKLYTINKDLEKLKNLCEIPTQLTFPKNFPLPWYFLLQST